MAAESALHVFCDVNVFIDAAISWNASNEGLPVIVRTPGAQLKGGPCAVLLLAIALGVPINQSAMVLHTSDQVLATVGGKLQDEYDWLPGPTDDFLSWIYDLVEASNGTVVETGSTIPNHQQDDREDNRVLGEALDTPARLLITNDQAFIDAGPYRGVVLITPRDFLKRAGLRPA
jgi:predicted nucleic acid-binding protein